MKTVMALTMVLSVFVSKLLPARSQALISAAEPAKAYSFKFVKFQGEVYEYETSASTKTEAFERAAQACFEHYKAGRHISMEYGQDIIDVCVNPRS